MELTEYHENGQLASIGKQRDGKKTGEWKVFYENGQLRYKGGFTEGIEDGAWEWYFENGQLQARGMIKQGELLFSSMNDTRSQWCLLLDSPRDFTTLQCADWKKLRVRFHFNNNQT